MTNMMTAAHWPKKSSSTAAEDTEQMKATHPKTPYQPHNDYKNDLYYHRKRFCIALVCLFPAVVSDVVSITLYVCISSEKRTYAWLLLTWLVVSIGITSMLVLLAPLYYRKYAKSKRGGKDVSGQLGTPLKALGRQGIEQEHTAIAFSGSFTCKKNGHQQLLTPPPSLHFGEKNQSVTSIDSRGITITTSHILTPLSPNDHHASPLRSSPTTKPPPRFPCPAQLRGQSPYCRVGAYESTPPRSGGDRFTDAADAKSESPDSVASLKAEKDRVARSDSLKKLREATLKRRQALEKLNGGIS